MEVYKKSKPARVVYVILRQAVRGKDGRLRETKTTAHTLHDTTVEEVWAKLEQDGEKA